MVAEAGAASSGADFPSFPSFPCSSEALGLEGPNSSGSGSFFLLPPFLPFFFLDFLEGEDPSSFSSLWAGGSDTSLGDCGALASGFRLLGLLLLILLGFLGGESGVSLALLFSASVLVKLDGFAVLLGLPSLPAFLLALELGDVGFSPSSTSSASSASLVFPSSFDSGSTSSSSSTQG